MEGPILAPRQSGRYVIFPARALDDVCITPGLLRILALLGAHANRDGICYPSAAVLGARIGISRQAVSRAAAHLAVLGYLKITPYHLPDGRQSSNTYQLIYDAELPPERQRQQNWPQPDVAGVQPVVAEAQPDVAGVQPQVYGGATSEVAGVQPNEVAGGATSEVAQNVQYERTHLTYREDASPSFHNFGEADAKQSAETEPPPPPTPPPPPEEVAAAAARLYERQLWRDAQAIIREHVTSTEFSSNVRPARLELRDGQAVIVAHSRAARAWLDRRTATLADALWIANGRRQRTVWLNVTTEWSGENEHETRTGTEHHEPAVSRGAGLG